MKELKLAIILISIFFFWGCNNSVFRDLNDNAIVVVRCLNVVTNENLLHRVIEVWRNDSNGQVSFVSNEVINVGIPVTKRNVVGEESLLFYCKNEKNEMKGSPRVIGVYSGLVPGLDNRKVGDLEMMIKKRTAQNLK